MMRLQCSPLNLAGGVASVHRRLCLPSPRRKAAKQRFAQVVAAIGKASGTAAERRGKTCEQCHSSRRWSCKKKNSSTKEKPEAEKPLPPYHMKETGHGGLQEQGFKGDDVEHNDMKTHTADWQKEYGPKHSNYKTMAEICKDYPKNPSCIDYLPEPAPAPAPKVKKSSAEGKMASLVLSISLLVLQAY